MTISSSEPQNLPVADAAIPKGWVSIAVNDLVKTQDHYFSFFKTPPQWVLSSFYTSDGYLNQGRQTYARPKSLRAKISIIIPVFRKLIKRWGIDS